MMSNNFQTAPRDPKLLYGAMSEDLPLNISSLIDFGAKFNPDSEIVTRTIEGPIHRYTNADALVRSKKVAQAITALGIKVSDRVGTIAFNTYRHFELYYGISGMGAVMNTINPRLHPEQFTYIVNHANDRILFVDFPLLPLVEKLWSTLKCVEHVVVLTDRDHMPKQSPIQDKLICYEELIAKYDGNYTWPVLDERLASSLCYTSGTTGNPKGVIYSHRSTVLHTLRFIGGNALNLNADTTVLPVVPMFHVNAWGLVYASPICGFKIVFPGAKMDGESIYELLHTEEVIFAFGVPTVWNMLLKHCEDNKKTLTNLERTCIGGSAVPESMIKAFQSNHNVEVVQGWGMTEMAPLGTCTVFSKQEQKLPLEKRQALIRKAGKAVYGVDMKIISDEGVELPHDGVQSGHLCVKGFHICSEYYNDDRKESFMKDGWFQTGDVAIIDKKGWLTITDRSKDVIKSGGEWISSLDLENEAQNHPNVFEAAVIGLPHPKWDERPLLIVVKKNIDEELTPKQMLDFLQDKVAKFWLPNDVVFMDTLPKQATGKIWKLQLRKQYMEQGYKFPI